MKEQFFRLKDWMKGKKRPPFRMEIMPSDMNQCNLSCKYCMRHFLDKDRVHYLDSYDGPVKNNISNEEYIELIDEAAELGVKRIGIAGLGEPMMNPGIMKIFERIKLHGLNGNLTTNGTLFDKEDVKRMIKMRWDLIALSLDGPDAETQDRLRPEVDSGGSFQDLLKTLNLFDSFKKRLGADLPEIILVPVLSKENIMKAPELIELASNYSIKRVEFKPLVTHGIEELEKYKIDEELRKDANSKTRKAKRLSEKYEIGTNIDKFRHKEFAEKSGDIKNAMKKSTINDSRILSIPCYDPWLKIEVHPGEKVVNACPVPFKEFSGSLDNQTLKETWYGEKFEGLRRKLKKREIPDFCKLCCGGNVLRNRSLREYIKNKEASL